MKVRSFSSYRRRYFILTSRYRDRTNYSDKISPTILTFRLCINVFCIQAIFFSPRMHKLRVIFFLLLFFKRYDVTVTGYITTCSGENQRGTVYRKNNKTFMCLPRLNFTDHSSRSKYRYKYNNIVILYAGEAVTI